MPKKVNRRIIVLLGKNMLWIDRPQKVNISVYLYASSKKLQTENTQIQTYMIWFSSKVYCAKVCKAHET